MKRFLCIFAALLLALTLFASCAKNADAETDYYHDMPADAPAEKPMMPAPEMDSIRDESSTGGFDNLSDSQVKPVQDRKIIYTAEYSISTENYDKDYALILQAVDNCGGYLSGENSYGTEPEEYNDTGRYSHLTLRIPVENYKQFLNTLTGIGVVTNKNQSTEDVTTEYYDNESRIEFYEAHYEKLMDYLEQATEMEDILSIEAQIRDTLYTLDSLKGTRNYYDNMTQYTTVYVNLDEVVHAADVVTSKSSLGERISDSFLNVLHGLGVFFEGFLVVLISALPILAILAAIFCVIFFPIHVRRKKKKAGKAAKENETKTE